jgi:hypothetical protein
MIHVLLLLICILPISISYIDPQVHSLADLIIDNSSLSITSFQFNPYSNPSEWIDRIFGAKSIFYDKRDPVKILSEKPLTDEEISDRFTAARKVFNLPSISEFPACSIEILAYGLIDVSHPLSKHARLQGPSYGNALLRLLKAQRSVLCYYRGLYENWRRESQLADTSYWPVAIYCPIINETTCKKVREHNGPHHAQFQPVKLVLYLENTKWTAQFRGRLNSKNKAILVPTTVYMKAETKRAMDSIANRLHTYDSPRIGVCLAIPYTSNDEQKRVVNSAILIDWIRYYSKLNFLIMIYDRDAANYESVFNNPRYKLPKELIQTNIAYHNYTISGLLSPEDKGMQYDNSELVYIQQQPTSKSVSNEELRMKKRRFESQGKLIQPFAAYLIH